MKTLRGFTEGFSQRIALTASDARPVIGAIRGASLLPAVAGLIERMFRQIGEAKPEFLAIRRRSSVGNPREWRTRGKIFSTSRNPTRSIYILDILIFLADWNVHIDSPFPKIVAYNWIYLTSITRYRFFRISILYASLSN